MIVSGVVITVLILFVLILIITVIACCCQKRRYSKSTRAMTQANPMSFHLPALVNEIYAQGDNLNAMYSPEKDGKEVDLEKEKTSELDTSYCNKNSM